MIKRESERKYRLTEKGRKACCANSARYRASHPEKTAFSRYRNSARLRGHKFSITFEQFMYFWGKDCDICGDPIATIGIDRVDNNIGYEINNLIPCCEFCNKMKLTHTMEAFKSHVLKIARRIQ